MHTVRSGKHIVWVAGGVNVRVHGCGYGCVITTYMHVSEMVILQVYECVGIECQVSTYLRLNFQSRSQA